MLAPIPVQFSEHGQAVDPSTGVILDLSRQDIAERLFGDALRTWAAANLSDLDLAREIEARKRSLEGSDEQLRALQVAHSEALQIKRAVEDTLTAVASSRPARALAILAICPSRTAKLSMSSVSIGECSSNTYLLTPTITSSPRSTRACFAAAASSISRLGMPLATASVIPPIASTCAINVRASSTSLVVSAST